MAIIMGFALVWVTGLWLVRRLGFVAKATVFFGAMSVAIFVGGCSPELIRVQAQVANGVALASNHTLELLEGSYRTEGLALIAAAPDRANAEARLVEVRQRWSRIWGVDADGAPCGVHGSASGPCRNGAWPGLVAADNAWALALERQLAGASIDLPTSLRLAESSRAAYCALRAVVPSGVTLPDPPSILTCGGSR